MSIAPAVGDVGFRRPLIAAAIGGAVVLGLDQASKAWFRANVEEWDWGPQIGPIRTKRVQHDEGVPNGMNDGSSTGAIRALAMVGTGSIGAAVTAAYVPAKYASLAIAGAALGGIMLGSTVGNAGDMLLRGSVTDFIHVDLPDRMDASYLVANVADVGIGVGYLGIGGLALGGAGYGIFRGIRAVTRA